MRLQLDLLLAVVLVAVPSVRALPRGASGEDPGSGVGDSNLLVEVGIKKGDDLQTTEQNSEDACESGFTTVDMSAEGVQSKRELGLPEEVEAEVEPEGVKNQESDQDSKEGSEPAENNAAFVQSDFFKRDAEDSSKESSQEEETVTSSEATKDQDSSEDEVPVKASKKSEGRISENSKAPAKSKNKRNPEENGDSTDSPLGRQDSEIPAESSPDEENDKVLVQAEPLGCDAKEDSETSDLEISQSDINEIIFGEEEESVEEVDTTEEASDVSDGETDDTQNKEDESEEASRAHQTGESLVQKRTATVEGSPEDGEVFLTYSPIILSPAEFFGHFEDDDSAPVTDEDEVKQ